MLEIRGFLGVVRGESENTAPVPGASDKERSMSEIESSISTLDVECMQSDITGCTSPV